MCCEVLCKRFQKKYQNNYEDLNWARLVFSSSPRHKGLFLQRLFSTTVVLLGWEEGRLIEEDSKDFGLLYSIIEVDFLYLFPYIFRITNCGFKKADPHLQ